MPAPAEPGAGADVDAVSAWEGEATVERLLAAGTESLTGFDTYWYSWAAIHPDTRLLSVP